ncbi:hypothetical protein JDV02_008879 [Purpureocillium takamizusanense]|uniref:Secreted protein n=1 Tax=Purpureocillium takamizusanense TaxID=2060973 RepID=A0A9Q8QPR3_9HYPO|nr:uncharacterized protein JDV02_008879 [Purpureocillium takamizusanense]UNI23036.1 hypothetical protein JDV02_008879 [Purpureocillium takamizusanense]
MKSVAFLAIALLIRGSAATPTKDPSIPSMLKLLHDPRRPYLKGGETPAEGARFKTASEADLYAFEHNAIRVGKCDGKVLQCKTTVWQATCQHERSMVDEAEATIKKEYFERCAEQSRKICAELPDTVSSATRRGLEPVGEDWYLTPVVQFDACTVGKCSKPGSECVVRAKETKHNFNRATPAGRFPDVYCW